MLNYKNGNGWMSAEIFSLNSSYYSEIPDAFFQETTQLRVLDLSEASLTPSPSSLGFLSNLRTLCLNGFMVQDIAVIGDLKRLQVLSLANSRITLLPKEMMQLSDLRVLDLRNCTDLKLIPRNVISSLSRLEYLSMKGSYRIEWQAKRFNSRERINACLSELKHLSGLRTLEVEVSESSLLPEDDVLVDNLNLTRYSIEICPTWGIFDKHKASRRMTLEGVKSLHMVNFFSTLLKRSQVVHLLGLNGTKHVVFFNSSIFLSVNVLPFNTSFIPLRNGFHHLIPSVCWWNWILVGSVTWRQYTMAQFQRGLSLN